MSALYATIVLPEDNLRVNLTLGTTLSFPLDLSIIPIATLLGVIWVVVYHDDHTRLQLVPLVHSTGPWTYILDQQLNHSILWVTVAENVTFQYALETIIDSAAQESGARLYKCV